MRSFTLFVPQARAFAIGLLAAVVAVVIAGCGRSGIGEDDLLAADAGGDGSPNRACVIASECDDRNACTVDLCTNGRCEFRPADRDNDGFVAAECGGDDCDDGDPNVNPRARELCSGGRDENCNGAVDCADEACTGQPGCSCGPREICGNGVDDDCNGRSDCDDDACANEAACRCARGQGTAENCTNGADDDCDGTVDCADSDCAAAPACACSAAEDCSNGRDDNCDGRIDCDDPTCAATQACVCRSTPENCRNGRDDNCNGLVDCADPACRGNDACGCNGRPARPEVCDNRQDDDCDGRVDCADPDCFASPACSQCTQEVCNDGRDNSCNGLIDCADPSCVFAPNCRPTAEICNNGIDDDRNGQTDCFDVACRDNPFCVLQQSNCNVPRPISASGTYTGDTTGNIGESTGSCGGAAGEAVFSLRITRPTRVRLDTRGSQFDTVLYVRTGACRAGRELACDDDSGGSRNAALEFPILYPGTYFIFVDGFTIDARRGPDQGRFVLNVDLAGDPVEVCGNGRDDDGDRLVDCADPDCASFPACVACNGGRPPTAEFGPTACTDGLDNDCDGLTDCNDPDCRASEYYATECCNGRDDNGNGIVDEFACRCANNGNCGRGQICYTDTASSCGPPCNGFVGDICPFVAPGSTCSTQTRQCAF